MNVLVVTVDQLRADVLSMLPTPGFDRLAGGSVHLRRHYSQAAPCAPGRACLYTGTYQLNNRVVGNGTPLDDRFDNLARVGRRAGFAPTLFGYTDVGIDPRQASGADDPRLSTYEEVLPGFDVELDLREDCGPWLAWLGSLGHDVSGGAVQALRTEPDRPAEHGITAFAVDRFVEWAGRQDAPWFAHLSLLRPHPPYAAAGHWATAFDPDEVGLPIRPADLRHPFHDVALSVSGAPADEAKLRRLRAQYLGMVADVDDQLGRVWDAIDWDDTFVVLTSDHGEQLGDHGLVGKLGWFEASYHVPAFVRDPRRPGGHGTVVDAFTENVDVLPTLCEALDMPVPAQCDGLPLTPFLDCEAPPWWRTAAHWEFDWRLLRPDRVAAGAGAWPWDRRLDRQSLAVLRTDAAAFVQFADGDSLGFDLAADPTWRTPLVDPVALYDLAREMLAWRAEHADRTHTGFVLVDGGVGRWPL
ncbi:MAG: phosphonate monoester hydrolase [Actinomycetia bacterium]|nr:phosphonate monoester hydrolase [Actinomycetes bacterium]